MNKVLGRITKRGPPNGSRARERCSTSLVMRGIPVQIVRFYYITRMTEIKQNRKYKCLWRCAANYWWECKVSAATLENFLTVLLKLDILYINGDKFIMQAQTGIIPHNCCGHDRQGKNESHFTRGAWKKMTANALEAYGQGRAIFASSSFFFFYNLIIFWVVIS